jgi:hypothetical protein
MIDSLGFACVVPMIPCLLPQGGKSKTDAAAEKVHARVRRREGVVAAVVAVAAVAEAVSLSSFCRLLLVWMLRWLLLVRSLLLVQVAEAQKLVHRMAQLKDGRKGGH